MKLTYKSPNLARKVSVSIMACLNKIIHFSLLIFIVTQIDLQQAYASEEFFLNKIQDVRLKTDFEALFKEIAPEQNEVALPGTLSFFTAGQLWTYTVEVSVRGNTSKYDCSFKKLSLKLDKNADGPLAGVNKLRINTHCSDDGQGYTEMGRVKGPAGPIREGLVYDWMRALGLSTYFSKVVPITYENSANNTIKQSFALFLESKKNLGSRLGVQALEEEDLQDQEAFMDRASEIARSTQTLKGLLFNAIIGNADFSLQLKDLSGERHYNPMSPPSGMWNILALDYGNKIDLVPTDFDVSGVVVQTQISSDPLIKKISGCENEFCEFQFTQVQKWRSFFNSSQFASVSMEIKGEISDLKNLVTNNNNLNAAEKKYFIGSLDSFMDVLEKRLNVPVLTVTTKVFLDADLQIRCGFENPEDGFDIKAPAGLPVKVLSRNTKSIHVLILDTRDQVLSNPNGGSCEGEVFLPNETSISPVWPK